MTNAEFTRFKWVGFGRHDEFGEVESFLVVPDHVTQEEILRCELSDDLDDYYDCVCECPTQEGAALIADLLNAHYERH